MNRPKPTPRELEYMYWEALDYDARWTAERVYRARLAERGKRRQAHFDRVAQHQFRKQVARLLNS